MSTSNIWKRKKNMNGEIQGKNYQKGSNKHIFDSKKEKSRSFKGTVKDKNWR